MRKISVMPDVVYQEPVAMDCAVFLNTGNK